MNNMREEIRTGLAHIQRHAQAGRFLIIDDLASMRAVTASQLRQLGVQDIREAANGAAALKILKSEPISIIFSDWNMPVMDGLELLIAVRTDPVLHNVPFIMITAEAERARVLQAIQLGVSELLVKPYTGGRFASCLARAVQTPAKRRGPVSAAAVEAILGRSADVPGNSAATPHPVAGSASGATAPGITPLSSIEKASILVVDDSPDNLTLLANIFMESFRVKLAHNGAKAIQIAQSDNPPDLILLDIMMPEMDGFEVARQLRGHPTSENIPIIFVTAMTDDATRIKGLELGAVDFVTKPVDPDALRMRVSNFMRYVELRRQMQADYDAMLAMAKLKDDVDLVTRHDMKGPLAAVLGLVQGVIGSDQLSAGLRQQLQLAEEATLQALNMVNLSAELYKIETGRFELRANPLPLIKILRRTAEMMGKAFTEKQLNVDVSIPSGVQDSGLKALGEEMFCYSVFENLLKNACEAAPNNSTITVQVFQENPLRITIENPGVVPLPVRDNFFHKFNSHGKSHGTGLGTYSARLLTEAQNGNIAMQTSDEAGTTVITVTLPVG
jgi:two-component system sensor histidine kinase/response regulator